MKPTLLLAATLLALNLTTPLAVNAADKEPVEIKELFKRAHPELADKEVLVKRIELQPGASAPPHVHPGMVTGYVERGSLEFQLKDEPLLKLKAGDTFFEPPGSYHMVARNPDATNVTVVIAFVVNPKGAPLSTPLEGHGKH
ncbi:quercetin dioxygenase-like cupin family protein [Roseimicrobium gellanilyticum]|uniref:Quercetin dioxygenase-like cupin family protein n=1 Tax=Roseimicrobium gellanilyticum TaxID=748857 RepID=A0A366HR24_9BACT|nr:cupin domain-containing protein [Roseimicrobium gellanilyticum]RBP46102.1 quercetin dioxygenase-like cupin family protein [Roseimicrobium gellanilyticum]